ncbi:hypothetical protein [Pseudonocardia kunmingensis]|uniref:Uncharacterized protein n=1 Tax=Pseudonocardia kunmingensis TaxID=630975 RepID=A0A543CX84_9PSEU|nr:hypothetical protein [Pseudonocardia kunmingensis]TQM01717.1 hypothetical protein FB558_8619 [Pseudonocardia kunmingensis]
MNDAATTAHGGLLPAVHPLHCTPFRPTGAEPVASALWSRLNVEHPVLSRLPARERLLAAA